MERPRPIARLRSGEELRRELARLDGRGYKAYRDLEGAYELAPGLRLVIDRAQADPFAPPSRSRLQIDRTVAAFPPDLLQGRPRAVATLDYIVRRAEAAGRSQARDFQLAAPGAEVLERSAAVFDDEQIELRLGISLPARGRRILGGAAAELLLERVPRLADASLVYQRLDAAALRRHVDTVEDQVALREQLEARGLVAFVAEDAILPRESGASQRPLDQAAAVPLVSPETMRTTLQAPHAGEVRGLGIPAGVTLVCGGAFHGKSTLLDAIARAVYDHVPGDGRERCVTRDDAVKVRVEPGRAVHSVDIRAFLGPLPGGRSTQVFSTPNASGSTSQAAGIVEALEAGTGLLLLDEDTCAANLLSQDRAMRALLREGEEPIIHLSRRLRQLHRERGVSSVLVLGGSGEAFPAADRVIQLVEFGLHDATRRARDVVDEQRLSLPDAGPWPESGARSLDPGSLDPSRGRRPCHVKTQGLHELQLGRQRLPLAALEQIVHVDQARAAGWILAGLAQAGLDDGRPLQALLDAVEERLDAEGMGPWAGVLSAELARPRRQELAAILSRLPGVRMRSSSRVRGGAPAG